MMKNLSTKMPILAVFFVANVGLAQPDWLKQLAQEAQGINPHKDAVAIILLDAAEVTISADGRSEMHVQIVAKILKPAGEGWGTLREAVSPFRKVKDLKGWVLLPEGKTRSLTKADVVEISVPEAAAYYDDAHTLVAALPEAKPGAIVAFEYKIAGDDLTGPYQSFVFQGQQPVRLAKFVVNLPEGWQLHKSEWHGDRLTYSQSGTQHAWIARDLPYQPEEPLMPSWYYLSPRVAVTCYNPNSLKGTHFSNWQAVARWCEDWHREAAVPDKSIHDHVQQLTQGLSTPEEKLSAIAAFVRDEIRYVAVEIGEGRWQPRPAAATLYNRYGDCKDKTALMRAMLQSVGIPSVSVIANTKYAVKTALPTPFQFNHCVVGIPLKSFTNTQSFQNACVDGWLFFDPTDLSTRLGDLPPALQGDLVLLATSADTVLHLLPYWAPTAYRRRYAAEAELHPDGSMTAKVRITDFGSWAIASRYARKTTPTEKLVEEWKTLLARTVATAALSNFQSGADGDSAWVSFQMGGGRYANTMSNFMLFKPDFFHASESPELTAEQRQHPIWFGPAMEIETDINWRLPAGWQPEVEVSQIDNDCGAANLTCRTLLADKNLRFRWTTKLTGHLLPVEQYSAARRVSQALSQSKGMAIVLKKS